LPLVSLPTLPSLVYFVVFVISTLPIYHSLPFASHALFLTSFPRKRESIKTKKCDNPQISAKIQNYLFHHSYTIRIFACHKNNKKNGFPLARNDREVEMTERWIFLNSRIIYRLFLTSII
jgi:hypothetical protein